MNQENFIFIYSTFPDTTSAEKLAELLVKDQLIACANIFPAGKSIYMWEGKIEKSDEVYALFKTKAELFETIKKEILTAHPYKTPCILKVNIDTGNEEYLSWISQNCKKP